MNYKQLRMELRTRIERAEEASDKSTAAMKGFWSGYITALKDIRDDTQTDEEHKISLGGEQQCRKKH